MNVIANHVTLKLHVQILKARLSAFVTQDIQEMALSVSVSFLICIFWICIIWFFICPYYEPRINDS